MTNSEEMTALSIQLMKWSEGLEKLNNQNDFNDEKPTKALAKFLVTIDFVSNEIAGFDKYSDYETPEALEIINDLRVSLRESVQVLAEYAESVKV